MDAAAAAMPVGFRFRPTDEELVRHYLKAKIAGRPHPDLLVIPDVDLAACEPWDLPARSVIKSDDPEWFFFSPRDRPKYPGTRHRANRSTAAGYWKATGKDRLIRSKTPAGAGAGTLIGVKKTLVFHRGRAPRGHRTAWIIHEYTATEPHLQSGLNGTFVLYRLFNKQDGETPNPDSESPSASSRGSPLRDDAAASMMRDTTLPSGLGQLTATNIATDHSAMACPLGTIDYKEQTTAQEDAFLDVLSQLPDLQPEQRYDGFGFPSIDSPMCPYTDHPFVENIGEPDFSAYFDSIISEQDLQDLLLDPAYGNPTGDAEFNTTALVTSTDNSYNDASLERSSTNVHSNQCADDTDAATPGSSRINELQDDTSDETSMVCRGADQGFHLNRQRELRPAFASQTGSQNSGALCPASSWTPYPQHLFDTEVEPSRIGMMNSDGFKGQRGWAEAPSMKQSSVPEFMDPQQGNAARRIRLACDVQRASACQPMLTPLLDSEADAGSCYSSECSFDNHADDYVNTASRTTGKEHMPAQLASSVEFMDNVQRLSLDDEDMLEVARTKPRRGVNLKQRLIQESKQATRDAHILAPKNIDRAPRERSPGTRSRPVGSVLRYLLLAVVVMAPLLVLMSAWKSLHCWSV